MKKIKATSSMKKVMASHFYDLDAATKSCSQKVAWCTSVGPAELLRAMGFLVYFPENHGAMLGATRLAMECIPAANSAGYSPDICSYLTSDIGAYIKGITPISKAYDGIESVPKPDVLVYNTNQCRDVKDWFHWYATEFNVPVIGIESFCNVDNVSSEHVRAISTQIEELIPTLEQVAGTKFDIDKLRETVALSKRCSDLWNEALLMASTRPQPMDIFRRDDPNGTRGGGSRHPGGRGLLRAANRRAENPRQ